MMNMIDHYMKLPYRMELIPDSAEGGFVVSFPDLPGCISSGESLEEALKNAQDAKHEWLLAAIENHVEIPAPDSLDSYSG